PGAPGRKHPYIDPIPAEYPPEPLDPTTKVPTLKQIKGWPAEIPSNAFVNDSEAPEFLDIYTSPRPILYLRANAGATGGNIAYNSKITGSFNPSFHYDLAAIQMYLNNAVPNDDFHDPSDTQHDP